MVQFLAHPGHSVDEPGVHSRNDCHDKSTTSVVLNIIVINIIIIILLKITRWI